MIYNVEDLNEKEISNLYEDAIENSSNISQCDCCHVAYSSQAYCDLNNEGYTAGM